MLCGNKRRWGIVATRYGWQSSGSCIFSSTSSSSSSLFSCKDVKSFSSTTTLPSKPLHGKTALVTGSTQGIGLGIATELARNGASLVLNGFGDEKEVEQLRQNIEEMSATEVHYIPADLSKLSQAEQLVDKVIEKFGKVDILINNAGIQHVAPISEFSTEKWEQIISINLSAVFFTMKKALPVMKKQGYGRIINISSVHGLVGSKEKSAYVASKHGVVGLTKVAALEYAGTGVTCNCVNPGWVLTDLVRKQIEAKAEQLDVSFTEAGKLLLAEKQPSLTFATAEQIGDVCVFLCSESAAQITGTCIPVDGGWTAQ